MKKAVTEHLARESQPGVDINTSDDESRDSAEEESGDVPAPKGVTVRMQSGVQVQPGDVLIFMSRKGLGDVAKLRLMNSGMLPVALSISTSEARAYTAHPCRLVLQPGECQNVEVTSNGLRRMATRPPLLVRAVSMAAERIDNVPWDDLQSPNVEQLQLSTIREVDANATVDPLRRLLGTVNVAADSANVVIQSDRECEDDDISFEEYQRRCLVKSQGMVAAG